MLEARNGTLLGLVVCAVVLFACVGCGEPKKEFPSAIERLAAVESQVKQLWEINNQQRFQDPTPEPEIDPQFQPAAMDKRIAAIEEWKAETDAGIEEMAGRLRGGIEALEKQVASLREELKKQSEREARCAKCHK